MAGETADTAYEPEPEVILDAHRRRWHDQEVFLAAQLRIIRQQQSDAALATSLLDLRTAVPEAASIAYRMTQDGTAVLTQLADAQSRTLDAALSTDAPSGRKLYSLVAAVLVAVSRTPPEDRRAISVPTGDGVESLDIARIIRRAANTLTRRKPDPESDPLTADERQVLVAAAYEGFDAYSGRLLGEWKESDEELAPIQRQQERLAAILGYGR